MNNRTIEIIANDTLFFKDGKPFSMGEDVWADGIFPPAPSVFYGALRTAYAFQKYTNLNCSFEEAIKASEGLNVKNIYIKIANILCFPFPYDLIKLKNKREDKDMFFAERVAFQNLSSDLASQLCLNSELKVEKLDEIHGKGFLPQSDFESYLLGNDDEIKSYRKLSEYLSSEAKVGIGRDDATKTTSGDAEGKMYRVGMQRPEKWDLDQKLSFVIEFAGIDDLENDGVFRLGAEGKTVKYQSIRLDKVLMKHEDIKSEIIKLVLHTPAIFLSGDTPEFLINNQFHGINFKLVAKAIGKPLNIGGFDMLAKKPKNMYKAVPPGSVYYLKTDCITEARKLFAALSQLESISDNGLLETENFKKQGFGKFFIGNAI